MEAPGTTARALTSIAEFELDAQSLLAQSCQQKWHAAGSVAGAGCRRRVGCMSMHQNGGVAITRGALACTLPGCVCSGALTGR